MISAVGSLNARLAHIRPDEADAEARFRSWHVEPLLNQAAELLERCLRDKLTHDSLRAQSAQQSLALTLDDELLKLDERILTNRPDGRTPEIDWQIARLQYSYDIQMGLRSEQDAIRQNLEEARDRYLSNKPGAKGSDPEYAQYWAATRQQTVQIGEHDRAAGDTGYALAAAQADAATTRLTLAARRAAFKRRDDLTRNGGPLDYSAQASRIEARVERDFRDAVSRLHVAAKGLRVIYGRELELAEIWLPTATTGLLETAVRLVREEIRFLAAFAQLDQVFSVCHSLRTGVSPPVWQNFVSGAKELAFELPEALLTRHTRARVRGLSCVALLKDQLHEWLSLEVSMPTDAAMLIPGSQSGVAIVPISQHDAPACTLGRISDYRSTMQPDVCGMISLMNLSPLSARPISKMSKSHAWKARVRRPPVDPRLCEDLILEVRLTGRPLP